MSVTVKIFTKHGGRPTLFQTREFEALPVTLGRDAVCTIALDDPMKHISRVHVELEEGEEGICWLSVVSKVNPVIVKGRRHGPGSRVPLESGDSFGMGEFEVQILFTERDRAAPAPAPSTPVTVSPVEKSPAAALAAEEEPSFAPQDIPPPEPGLFDEPTFIGGDEPTYMGPSPAALARPSTTVEMPAVPRASAAPAAAGSSMKDAVRSLLEGAGMRERDLTPEQSEKLLRECGAILRVAVEGLTALVIAGGEMRKAFQGQEGTKVVARETNPLKLMSEPREAMEFMLDTAARSEGFLEPLPALTQAAEDVRAHEMALMAGMRAAVLGALRRLDPKVLEKAFEKSGGGFSLGGRKARMWELFLTHQQQLVQEAQKDFNQVFGRDFMAGYEAELRRSKTGR